MTLTLPVVVKKAINSRKWLSVLLGGLLVVFGPKVGLSAEDVNKLLLLIGGIVGVEGLADVVARFKAQR